MTYQLGGTPDEVRLDSPLFDTTNLEVCSSEVRVASESGGAFEWLVNAGLGEYVDIFEAGILDPAKVTRLALWNAASVAGLLLTIKVMIA